MNSPETGNLGKSSNAAILLLIFITTCITASADIPVTIHLRGVHSSKITILGLTDARLFKPVVSSEEIMSGDSVTLVVPAKALPGEFVMRFDYRENPSSTPYPSEKHFFINRQPLVLHASPKYCNNQDSTRFQEGEIENARFLQFSAENGRKKEQLGLLQNFLMSYDDDASKFFRMGIDEFEMRRNAYNKWLKEQTDQDRELFISSMYPFQYVPMVSFKGTEKERMQSVIDQYFSGFDFRDPNIIRTSYINKWMDNYVNMYGQLATTTALRDSLFPLAGRTAIEKAKKGDPRVYGWMVDYFFRGYESNGIDAGIKMLEPYLNDPNCLTSKRQEITRRLEGIATIKPGTRAPGILMQTPDGGTFDLSAWKPETEFILVVFWSAGCSHCTELVNQVYPWHQTPGNGSKVSVVAISLDETDTDITSWNEKKKEMTGWIHLHDREGVRSKVANDYFILSTPMMVLMDSSGLIVRAVPQNLPELLKALK